MFSVFKMGEPCESDADWKRPKDLTMPRTMVMRLAKGVLPPNTQIQKDAVSALSKGATVLINYLAHAYVSLSYISLKTIRTLYLFYPLALCGPFSTSSAVLNIPQRIRAHVRGQPQDGLATGCHRGLA